MDEKDKQAILDEIKKEAQRHGELPFVRIDRIPEILTAHEGDWISVDDRLPEKYKKVLCFGNKPITTRGVLGFHPMWHIARYDGSKFPHPNRNGGILDYITHWQPLPPPSPQRKVNDERQDREGREDT